MRPALIVIVVALALGGMTAPARSCSCATPPPPLVALGRADGVFSGEVIRRRDPEAGDEIWSSMSPIYYTLRVEDVWKGDISDTVAVRTAGSSASCGYPFRMDESYLVYATRDSTGWRTGLCTRTKSSNRAADDLAAFADADLTGSSTEIDERLVRDAIGRLFSEGESTRVAAAGALENMGKRPDLAMPALAELYERGTDADRRAAVSALGRLAWGHPNVVDAKPTLFAALRDPSVNVRLEAISALSRMQDDAETIVPHFEQTLEDTSGSVRARAANAIQRMYMLGHEGETSTAPLLAALENEDEASRGSVLRALAETGPDSLVVRLVARILAEDPSADVRTSAVYSLNKLDAQSAEVTALLLTALEDRDEGVRAQAVMGLAGAGESGVSALAELRRALDDPTERVRDYAVMAFARLSLDLEEAWTELLAALHHDLPDVRASAASRIVTSGETRDPNAAVVALEAAMCDTSFEVLGSAANSLGGLAKEVPAAVPILMESLSHERARVRRLACAVLGRAGPNAKEAVPALMALEHDPDQKVSDEALRALNRILRE